ncbi:TonB-dependent receptor [Granulicella arctica]|uniref:TonB-dependent receptor n=1 Tax=Granulicella arctica TaxID=940613 RepID=UPI0021E07AE2|nr:TonB-dependent receptor [Granulicella arctica]
MQTKMIRGMMCLGVCALLLSSSGFGQAVYGSIYGTVTDNSGAVVPNATITVTDTAKGSSDSVQSNASGEFTVDHLIPDPYEVKISIAGFKGYQQKGLQIFADTSTKITAALEVGDAAGETITVNADSVPQLKTDRADVSTIFSGKEFVDLPIPGRNFTGLQLLLPGAQQLGFTHAASENPQGSLQIEVDGQSFAGTAFQLDGTDNQDPILGIIVVNPNADALSESKITTQNYDAEFGKAVSSVVTAQTKSGTNSFHGSAFDYRQSNAQLARDPFTQSTGPQGTLSASNPFPVGLKNQFGGSIGGPILKDKLFFFGDYQGTRQKSGIAIQQTVPTSLLTTSCLSGAGCNFSEYTKVTGPIFHTVGGQRVAYANSIVPQSDLSPQALGVLKLLQPFAPNTVNGSTTSGLVQNYSASGTGGFNADQWDVRGDYTLNARTHVFGRFSRFTDTLTGTTIFGAAGGAGFGIGDFGGTSKGANDSVAAGVDYALNSRLVTDVRLGYFRYDIATSKYDQTVPFATQLGIPGLNTGAAITNGAPAFNITEAGSYGSANNNQSRGPQYGSGLNINRCNCPLTEREDQYQVANNWTKTIGNHSIKFGVDLRYARNLRVPSDNNRTGILTFGTGPTSDGTNNNGLGMASFLTGQVTQLQRYVSTSTNAKEFQKRAFGYAQDTWRATQKLTVNYGLRYEAYMPEAVNGAAQGALLNLDTGYLQVAGVGPIQTNMNQSPATGTYAPRLGLAYQAMPNTVIRAGYGRSFDIGVFGSVFGHSATQNLPVLANQALTAPGGDNATDTTAAFSLATGPQAFVFPAVPASGLLPNQGYNSSGRSRPTTLRLPTLDAWNLALQQSFTPTLSMTIAYVGNKGTHTFGDNSGNTTNPNEAAIFLPAQYSVNGQPLHYDPSATAGNCYPAGANCAAGGILGTNGQPIANSVLIPASGAVSNQVFLQRYYGGKLAACSDATYNADGTNHNAPNGGCGWNQSITYFGDDLNTSYNALQVTFTKIIAHGYSLNANYAWQKSLSEQTGFATWSHAAARGRDSSLRQQQVIVYGMLELPFGHNKHFLAHTNRIIDQIVSGYQISPVVNYSSGLPYTLSAQAGNWVPGSAPRYINGNPKQLHTHVTGFPGGPSGLSYYDITPVDGSGAFSLPALDTIGSAGRNSAFGPNFFNTDISVQKDFEIREKISFQLRADGYNAFNHINWGTPNGNIDQGGSISSGAYPNNTSNPRQLQFSGRLQF